MKVFQVVRLNFKMHTGHNVCTQGPNLNNTPEIAVAAVCSLAGIDNGDQPIVGIIPRV